jgi:hypothetical protein
VSVAIGPPAVCLEWSAGRALAAGASEDEIAYVLLAIAQGGFRSSICRRRDLAVILADSVVLLQTPAVAEPIEVGLS